MFTLDSNGSTVTLKSTPTTNPVVMVNEESKDNEETPKEEKMVTAEPEK